MMTLLIKLLMMCTIYGCSTEEDDVEPIIIDIELHGQQPIIAHRGYHHDKNTPQNSLAAFKEALLLNIYASECDVRQTSDGVFVISHDDNFDGLSISRTPYMELGDHTLSNGEPLPQLEHFLQELKMANSRVKLALDIKDCNINELVALVQEYGVLEKVLFIGSHRSVCNQLRKKGLGGITFYLTGNMSPTKVKQSRYGGIDYKDSIYDEHPLWIKEAKTLGLKTIVWTVNDKDAIYSYIRRGVIVTTDKPMFVEGVKKQEE
ncbi:MAG: hypothetical protein IKX36_01050 [Prevotella sp.]|nr:hypothetical protein [Prevotella sp.]